MLQKLWRGELSLPLTYWVFGVAGGWLVTLLVFALFGVLEASSDLQDAASQITGYLITCVTFLLYFVWVNVGIWRSASRHPNAWGTVAKVMVVFGVLRFISAFATGVTSAMGQ
jgi:hypothetical protein